MSIQADDSVFSDTSVPQQASVEKKDSVYTDAFKTIPYGPLGIIALPGCETLAQNIDKYLVEWRKKRQDKLTPEIAFYSYMKNTYILNAIFDRFGSGEGKCTLKESVRGYDIFILCDFFNYNETYKIGRGFLDPNITNTEYDIPVDDAETEPSKKTDIYAMLKMEKKNKLVEVNYTPDEHYADLKRAIAALGGKARRITVIMPMLYEGRQHKRSKRESLDCALVLQELCRTMGVDDIITFDAHDPRVMNAIPLNGFENIYTAYQMIKALINNIPELKIDKNYLAVISPDVGGIGRAVYYSSVLGVELGMFYKRRDYSQVKQGKNSIKGEPEYLGPDIAGKDVIVVDDMISTGESIISTCFNLKKRGARNIYICCAFGIFCDGLDIFDRSHEIGIISKIFTTNLIYRSKELKSKPWYCEVDLSKYMALIIDTLNHDMSLSPLLNHSERISNFLKKKNIVVDTKLKD